MRSKSTVSLCNLLGITPNVYLFTSFMGDFQSFKYIEIVQGDILLDFRTPWISWYISILILKYLDKDCFGFVCLTPYQSAQHRVSTIYNIVLASRASGCHLDTQILKNSTLGHPNILWQISRDTNFKQIILKFEWTAKDFMIPI